MLADNPITPKEYRTILKGLHRRGMDDLAGKLIRLRKMSLQEPPSAKQAKSLGHFNMPAKLCSHFENDWPTRRTNALLFLAEAIKEGKRTIILTGRPGIGKSFSACRWLQSNHLGKFVLSSHLVALNEHLIEDRNELYFLQRCTNLVIDDLGRGAETERDKARLCDFICQREDNNLWTVCTAVEMPDFGATGASLKRRLTIKFCE